MKYMEETECFLTSQESENLNMSEENPALLQEIVTVAAEDTTGRDDEENETIIPAKETNW